MTFWHGSPVAFDGFIDPARDVRLGELILDGQPPLAFFTEVREHAFWYALGCQTGAPVKGPRDKLLAVIDDHVAGPEDAENENIRVCGFLYTVRPTGPYDTGRDSCFPHTECFSASPLEIMSQQVVFRPTVLTVGSWTTGITTGEGSHSSGFGARPLIPS